MKNSNMDQIKKMAKEDNDWKELEDDEDFNGVYVCSLPHIEEAYNMGALIRYCIKIGKEFDELTREEKEPFRTGPFYHYHELAKYLKRNKKVFEKLTPEEKARFEIPDDEYYSDPTKYYMKTDEMGKLIMDNEDA